MPDMVQKKKQNLGKKDLEPADREDDNSNPEADAEVLPG